MSAAPTPDRERSLTPNYRPLLDNGPFFIETKRGSAARDHRDLFLEHRSASAGLQRIATGARKFCPDILLAVNS